MRRIALVWLGVVAACGGGSGSAEGGPDGAPGGGDAGDDGAGGVEVDAEALYREPLPDGNTFACATCHALEEPAEDGIRRVGHRLGDATRRPSWKDGKLDDMRLAVATCLEGWMNAEPWGSEDPRWAALHGWLDAMAPDGEAPPVDMQRVEPPEDLAGGDAEAGRALFNSACVGCHGVDAAGTERAPKLTGVPLDPSYVALRVRTSGSPAIAVYEGLTGGIMPFWGADRLSDGELRDLIAWLVSTQEASEPSPGSEPDPAPEAEPEPAPDAEPEPAPEAEPEPLPGSGCPKTHAKVGWKATLEKHFHDVGGVATITDDCTIVIEGFTFDGGGIDVRIYGGKGGEFDPPAGFAISDDLVKPGGYQGETLVLELPPRNTFDDLDAVSVWCVAVGVSFGDGTFEPP